MSEEEQTCECHITNQLLDSTMALIADREMEDTQQGKTWTVARIRTGRPAARIAQAHPMTATESCKWGKGPSSSGAMPACSAFCKSGLNALSAFV
jgi:hypothetical protein